MSWREESLVPDRIFLEQVAKNTGLTAEPAERAENISSRRPLRSPRLIETHLIVISLPPIQLLRADGDFVQAERPMSFILGLVLFVVVVGVVDARLPWPTPARRR